MSLNRRIFVKSLALTAGSGMLDFNNIGQMTPSAWPISCNQYSWITFFAREGRNWNTDPDISLGEFASAGLTAYEPAFNNAEEVGKILPYLKKYNLSMPSVYVNSSLHQKEEATRSIRSLLAIADALKPANTKIIVTNPNPLKWGSDKIKSDEELAVQAQSLDQLGAELKKRGMKLAYHTHDVELKAAAREFHHMLLATDPKNVSLCLDVHWVYRGSGNSQIALFDIVKLYGKRIVELHIRQSKDGIWQETFGDGDIDYPRLVSALSALHVKPHLVLEQCLEKTSPKTMNGVEAHKADLAMAHKVFAKWLS
ncbi:sugar phosphate isomerase/epimerase family protein [Dyadobacter helix]|nr:sugar phosphate isomerase/epimerase [Dyadobacter sp. CECT 9275]